MNNITSVNSLSKQCLGELIDEANKLAVCEKYLNEYFKKNKDYLNSKILVTFFDSYSLRTRASFISSFLRLGGSHMEFRHHEYLIKRQENFESVSDTFGFISQYCDCLVVRCKSSKVFFEIKSSVEVPIISAGHGDEENPTTAINYLASIKRKLGRLDSLNILVLAKPPKRCVNSLVRGLSNWKNNNFTFYNPFSMSYYIHQDCQNIPLQIEPNKIPQFQEYDLIFMDESRSDYLGSKSPGLILDDFAWKKIKSKSHLIHAKPVIGLISVELKNSLHSKMKIESRNSSVMKSLIYKKLINV